MAFNFAQSMLTSVQKEISLVSNSFFVGHFSPTHSGWILKHPLGQRSAGTGTTGRDLRNGDRSILRKSFEIVPTVKTAVAGENLFFFVKPRKVRWNAGRTWPTHRSFHRKNCRSTEIAILSCWWQINHRNESLKRLSLNSKIKSIWPFWFIDELCSSFLSGDIAQG